MHGCTFISIQKIISTAFTAFYSLYKQVDRHLLCCPIECAIRLEIGRTNQSEDVQLSRSAVDLWHYEIYLGSIDLVRTSIRID